MNQLPKFELMCSEYGTAITVDQKIIGWLNRTVDGKLITTVGENKSVVFDTIEDALFLIEIKLGGLLIV